MRLQDLAHRNSGRVPITAAARLVSAGRPMGTTGAWTSVFVTGYRIAFLCGHSLRVYNSCGSAAGEYDGVVYQDYRAFGREPSADLVVVWRWPWLETSLPPRVPSLLWLEDMIEPEAVAAAAHRYRKIIVLSRFHRQHYSALPDEKFFFSRNGIHPEQFDQTAERDPYKVVYGSSYDRGLLPLLEAWPRVKAQVPQASLTVFYGFQAARARAFQLIGAPSRSYR